MFGLGPVPAVRQALERAGWKIGDVERVEINEAFAAIALAVMRELGLPEDIVNVEGNAIAHGHPIGATGALLTTRLLHSMQRDGLKRGIVTMCIGGGQGTRFVPRVRDLRLLKTNDCYWPKAGSNRLPKPRLLLREE